MPTVSVKKAAYWVDITNPQKKHLEWLKREFNIHPVILEELRGPSARPRTEVYKDYIYFIYYFPDYDHGEETSKRTEIDFLVTKNHVITVHYEDIKALQGFSIEKEENPLRLLYRLIQALLQFQERQLGHIREKVEEIGKELFKDKEKEILRRISRLKRDISEYRIIVRHQGPILESLALKAFPFVGTSADRVGARGRESIRWRGCGTRSTSGKGCHGGCGKVSDGASSADCSGYLEKV